MTEPLDRLSAALAGRYIIERELGQGGMATVYLAEDVKHKRKVALKVLKPELAAVLGAERFVQEITTTAGLQHPHILPLFDSGTAGEEGGGLVRPFLYYVMPYIEGETLRDKVNREKQLDVDEAVRIATEVADALDYAHRQGVIHRDIKPENILLHDGRPMVADFGIALAVSAAAGGRMTETGLSLGTPHYMSPEQATAEKDITGRSDVYSLGAVLYEMLTGDPPHTGSTAQQIIMKIVTEEAQPLAELRRSVPHHVGAAVAKSLQKLPADRFATSTAFADALGNPSFTVPGTMGVSAAGPGATRRGPRAFVWPAAAVVAVVIGVWGWMRPAPPLPVSRYSVTLPDDQGLNPEEFRGRVAVTPDERIIYVGGGSRGGSQLWIRPRDQLVGRALTGTEGAKNPSVSPDGTKVAFVTEVPGVLKWVSLEGGPATTVTDSLVDAGGVSWGYDGYIYYDGHLAGDGIARVRENGGTPEPVSWPDSSVGELWHSGPSALPNGRGVLIKIANTTAITDPMGFDLAVVEPGSRAHRILIKGVVGAHYLPTGHLLYLTAGGTLMAAPFDQDRMEVTGDALPIAEHVAIRALGMHDVAVSRSGMLVYATGDNLGGRTELAWVSRDGTVEPIETRVSGVHRMLALSPDGSRLAMSFREGTDQQIWVKDLDRGPMQKITFEGNTNDSPAWTPAGDEIAFRSNRDGIGVLIRRADGMESPRRLHAPGVRSLGGFSPDGRWLLFQRDRTDLFATEVAGDSIIEIIPTGVGRIAEPMVSPDGRWLSYMSDEQGQWDVFVRPFPSGEGKWLVSPEGGLDPKWSADGRELFHRRSDGMLVAVEILPGNVFTFGVERPLFWIAYANDYVVAPDGQRFLVIRLPDAGTTSELVVVENFFTAIKERFGR